MNVEIQKLDKDAKIPEYAHASDAGMDIFSLIDADLEPGERKAIKTGIAIAIPAGHAGLIWDKSGRALKEGITVMGGVIDAGYRGEVQVIILNTGDEPINIDKHQKIAQIVVQPVVSPELEEVDRLSDSERGEGGFGSTGL